MLKPTLLYLICCAVTALGQNWLGHMYEKGDGVAQSIKTAVRWNERAALSGDSWAQTKMGMRRLKGEGLPLDLPRAKVSVISVLRVSTRCVARRGRTCKRSMHAAKAVCGAPVSTIPHCMCYDICALD